MILSLADHLEAKRKRDFLRSGRPHCGPCWDQWGDIEQLLPITLWDDHGEPIRGLWCQCCGEEFHQ